MRVALTGASGFVGGAVLPRLLAGGHQVRLLMRAPPDSPTPEGVTLVRGDLLSRDALFELVTGVDCVVHVAGAVKARSKKQFMQVNAVATAALAEAAISAGVKRFVHVSSLAARSPEVSAYAASKRAAEEELLLLRHNISTLIIRPAAVYGPGDKATLPLLRGLLSKVALLPGWSSARFSMIHVDDLAAVIAEAADSALTGMREVDDLSGGHDWAEITRIVKVNFGRPGLAMHIPYGIALAAGAAASTLGFFTRHGFVFGMGKVREMYEPSWLVEGENWPRGNPVSLLDGLPQTIRWNQDRGLLPHRKRPHD
jgi:nucleoside-diphosphate-sugar epimerase